RHLGLNRNCDVALDLLGRFPGALRHDVHQRPHRIGIRLYVKQSKGADPGHDHEKQRDDDQHTTLERKCDNGVHGAGLARWALLALTVSALTAHSLSASSSMVLTARSMKTAPFVTTVSPGLSEPMTSTMSPLVRPVRTGRSSSRLSPRATHTRANSPS